MTEKKQVQEDQSQDQEDKDMMKPTDKKWKDRSTKEKLDFVFVIVAILGFSLGAIVNYKNLKKMK